jgi:hypothetical protein
MRPVFLFHKITKRSDCSDRINSRKQPTARSFLSLGRLLFLHFSLVYSAHSLLFTIVTHRKTYTALLSIQNTGNTMMMNNKKVLVAFRCVFAAAATIKTACFGCFSNAVTMAFMSEGTDGRRMVIFW